VENAQAFGLPVIVAVNNFRYEIKQPSKIINMYNFIANITNYIQIVFQFIHCTLIVCSQANLNHTQPSHSE